MSNDSSHRPYKNSKYASYYKELPFRIPSLIQRIERKDYESHAPGIDSAFSMDYMGRAEFEWGALPQSLKHMRATTSHTEDLVVQQITEHVPSDSEHPLFYVGRPQELPMAEAIVYAEFDETQDRPLYLFKEPLHMRERLLPHKQAFSATTDGWWALNPDHHAPEFVPFALFIKEEYATLWKNLLTKAT